MATAIVYSDRFLQHRVPEGHPESPARLVAIKRELEARKLWSRGEIVAPRPATEREVLAVHRREHLLMLQEVERHGGGMLDMDTFMSRESLSVALLAAGAALTACELVQQGKVRNALALVRPPGHHATSSRAMGFCLLNNVAIAASWLKAQGLRNILIVDWDLHHGNGTQEVFWRDGRVSYLSLHQYPHYPGTGSSGERGAGEGKIMNVPLAAGTTENEYLARFQEATSKMARRSSPEFILISAGFDAHENDPLGSLRLTAELYRELTEEVLRLARSSAQGRVVSVLEGGYDLEVGLPHSVAAHLEALLEEG